MFYILQTTVWYLGIGLLLSCIVILIDEQVRKRIKEHRDEKNTDNH
jgi:hypothetical protein